MLALVIASSFSAKDGKFFIDNEEFVIYAGEMYPQRIPYRYWEHRILMSKAMGMNSISVGLFWSDFELEDGSFDFASEQNNIKWFLYLCKEHGLKVLLRPGPFLDAEFDYGGIPSRFAQNASEEIRSTGSEAYKNQSRAYFAALAKQIAPFFADDGGLILMIALEDDYGAWPFESSDYLLVLRDALENNGVKSIYFETNSIATWSRPLKFPVNVIGIDGYPGDEDFSKLGYIYKGKTLFAAKVFTGTPGVWNTSISGTSIDVSAYLEDCVAKNRSFILRSILGGTNFALQAGSKMEKDVPWPFLTSNDNGAPIKESGAPGEHYYKYRAIMQNAYAMPLIDVPEPIQGMQVTNIKTRKIGGLADQFVLADEYLDSPMSMEYYGQKQGLSLYRCKLPMYANEVRFEHANGYCQVYLDGKYATARYFFGITNVFLYEYTNNSVTVLELLCECYGHVQPDRFPQEARCGLFGPVQIDKSPIKGWSVYRLPVENLPANIVEKNERPEIRGGVFRADFDLKSQNDTYLNLSLLMKGYVYVNGHNLGRYWKAGPYQRLFCPGSWLKPENNTLYVIDIEEQGDGAPIIGFELPEGCPEGQKLNGGICQ